MLWFQTYHYATKMPAYDVITCSHPILNVLFKSLDLFNLYNVRQVCKLWKTEADYEIKRRRDTPEVDVKTISFPVDKKRSQADTMNLFVDNFTSWERSWNSTPSLLLISPWIGFGFKMDVSTLPSDCVGVVIEGSPVCVDGIFTESEDVDQEKYETFNLAAFHRLNDPSVTALIPDETTKDFFDELHTILSNPSVKFIILAFHSEMINTLKEKSGRLVDEAVKRGIVILCYSTIEVRPILLNYRGRECLQSMFVAIYFKGNVRAASTFVKESSEGGINQLVEDCKKLDVARKTFIENCCSHEMNDTGFCRSCISQTLGFLLAPLHHPHYGYEYDEDIDPRLPCFNQEQDAFRFVIPNVPLIGWLNDSYLVASTVNVCGNSTASDVLNPVDDSNFIYGLLVLK